MEITDANGQHVGIIGEVEDERLHLTRSHSDDKMDRYLPLDAIDGIHEHRTCFEAGRQIPTSGTVSRPSR